MTLRDALRTAIPRLEAAGVETPRRLFFSGAVVRCPWRALLANAAAGMRILRPRGARFLCDEIKHQRSGEGTRWRS